MLWSIGSMGISVKIQTMLMSGLPDCHKAVPHGIPWSSGGGRIYSQIVVQELISSSPMLNNLRDLTTLQFACLHVIQDFVCTVENRTLFSFFPFNFLENQANFFFSFCTPILVPTPSLCSIPSTFTFPPPATPPIQSSESGRHFALRTVQGPPC